MSTALDFTTGELVSLTLAPAATSGTAEGPQSPLHVDERVLPLSYVAIRDNADIREWLDRVHAPYAEGEGYLLILGDSARTWSELADLTSTSLLTAEGEPRVDRVSRQLWGMYLDAALPPASSRNQTCALLDFRDPRADTESGYQFVEHLVRLRGYEPHYVSPATALLLATLADEEWTGLGFVVEPTGLSMSLLYRGREVFSHALVTPAIKRLAPTLVATGIAAQAETAQPEPSRDRATAAHEKRRLRELLLEQIGRLVHPLRKTLGLVADVPWHARPWPIVCAGSLSEIEGFPALLHDGIRHLGTTLPLGYLTAPADHRHTLLRGGLIAATLNEQDAGESHAA